MTMEDLYEEMKASLEFFNLRFHEMGEVNVTIPVDGAIVFEHNQRTIQINVDD